MARQVDIAVSLYDKPVITSLDRLISKMEQLNNVKEKIAPKGKIKLDMDNGSVAEVANGLKQISAEIQKIQKATAGIKGFGKEMSAGTKEIGKAATAVGRTAISVGGATKKIGKAVSDVKKASDNLKGVGSDLKKPADAINGMAKDLIGLQLALDSCARAYAFFRDEYLGLEENAYGVGVAAQMTTREIGKLNDEFINLSKGTSVSAKDLAKATDDLIRTGQTFADAKTIMAEVSKLSVASGESLKDTSEVATKIIVSLGLEAENTGKALTALHSVAIQTASSMGGLAESFKQFAGTLGVFASTSGLAGEELQDYKQDILELGLSATGVLNNLGLSAGTAGTKIKILFSKLVSLENTATKLFNKDMLGASAYVDDMGKISTSSTGTLLTADKLASIATKNLPQAIELLSQLYMSGKIGLKTLQKMFTGRHFPDIAAVLRGVGGDVESFNEIYAQGIDYQADYAKQTYNINNQLKTLKNNVVSLGEGGFGYLGTFINSNVYAANRLIESNKLNMKVHTSLATYVIGLGAQYLVASKALGMLNITNARAITLGNGFLTTLTGIKNATVIGATHFKASTKQMLSFNSSAQSGVKASRAFAVSHKAMTTGMVASQAHLKSSVSVMQKMSAAVGVTRASFAGLTSFLSTNAMAIGIVGIAFAFQKYNEMLLQNEKNASSLIETYSKSGSIDRRIEAIQKQLDDTKTSSQKLTDAMQKGFAEITSIDKITFSLSGLLGMTNTLEDRFIAIGKAFGALYDGVDKKKYELELAQLESQQVELKDKKDVQKANIRSKILTPTGSTSVFGVERDIVREKISPEMLDRLFDLLESKGEYVYKNEDNTTTTKQISTFDDFYRAIAQESNVTKKQIASLFGEKTVVKDMDLLAATTQEQVVGAEQLEKILTIIGQNTQNEEDAALTISEGLEKSFMEILQKQIDTYKKHGSISVDGTELVGADAFKYFVKTSYGTGEEGQAEYSKEGEKLFGEFMGANVGIDLKTADGMEYALKQLEYLKTAEAIIASRAAKIEEEKGVSEQLLNTMLSTDQRSALEAKQKILTADIDTDNTLLKLNEAKRLADKYDYNKDVIKLKETGSRGGGSRGGGGENQEYNFEYKSFAKELLDLELERAKVGKTIGEQSQLEYTYKIKQLQVNKELAQKEYASLSSYESLSGEDLSVEKGNLERLIALRNEISSTRTQTGASGKANKQKVDDLDSVISSMMKILELEQQIQLEPLKELRSIIDSLPNVFRKANTAMKGLDDNPLSKWNAIDLSDMEEEVVRTLERIKNGWLVDGVSVFGGMNESNVDTHLSNSKDSVKIARANAENALKKKESGDVLTADDENKIAILKAETEQLNDIIAYKEQINEKDKAALDLALAKLDTINQIGGALSALGNTTGMKGFGDLGGVVDSFGTLTKSIKGGKHDFDFGKMFDFKNIETDAFAENFGKGMQAAVDGLNMGSMVGQFVGGFTGGGASAQAGGALGGMIGTMGGGEALAGALGMGTSALATGGASLAISAGMSLIGGLFEDDGEDQKEAERKTKEANKTYEKNTDALNKLAQNMASLSGGVDGLNSTLISSFSKIPTFGKLTDVTDTMKDMYATMEKTRAFNEVAYQVTKTKKGSSGFMGIGATADTSWTETIEVSVQEMLNKYGFKGTIEDMTTDQLRDFSTWLDDYDMGDSDNFSILADAIEDYAEALDKFDKNIDKFFYDTTMESFNGISSLDQEELRQQIEDFYKDLGYQIDDEMSKVIDELAQNMSVMVTIMQDVRGEFVSNWRESGGDAGSAFVSSMSPYIDAMLGNISQIFYDVYYSDVTESLEDSFKKISEELVELKKQGADLDWSNVTGSLATEFDKVLSAMISAKQEATSFNDVIMALQQQAIEAGLTLSEIFELGLTTGTQGDVLEMFKSAVLSDSDDGALTAIGDFMGDKIGEALSNKLMDNLFSTQILEFSNQLDSVLSGELKFSQLAGLMSQANAIGIGMEQQRLNLEAIMAGFNFDQDITYETDASKVEYSAGTSQQNTYVYNISSSVNAGNVIESDSINSLAEELLDVIIEKLKVDKGIDITKNY